MKISAKNPWGSEAKGGLDTQRSDLWVADFSDVIKGLNLSLDTASFYVKSITFPKLEVEAASFRRNNSARFFPGLDTAPGPISMEFHLDIGPASTSKIYTLLNTWRAAVRGGRGPASDEIYLPVTSPRYYVPFKFSIPVLFLATFGPTNDPNPFEPSMGYRLDRAWLASFSIGQVDYGTSDGAKISADFYADDIVQLFVQSPNFSIPASQPTVFSNPEIIA